MTTATNTTSKSTKTEDKPRALNLRTLATLIERADDVASTQRQTSATIEDVKWTTLDTLTGAYGNLGAHLVGSVLKQASGVKPNGDAIRKAMADKSSGIYVSPDQRASLPSASTMSRAIAVHTLHNAARFGEYRSATDDKGNTNVPSLERYVTWLAIADSGKVNPQSRVDAEATKITGKGASRKVGPLVLKPSASTPKATTVAPSSATVVGFFSDLLKMSADELAAIVADGPDVSGIASARLRDVARVCMARITMEEMSDKLVVTI